MKEVIIKDKKICSGATPLICVSLMGETFEEVQDNLTNILDTAEHSRIDIVEFRGDYYKELENVEKLQQVLSYVGEEIKDKILLFTIRSPREGGVARDYGKKSIEEINRFVIDNKLADMVDVEYFSVEEGTTLIKLAKEKNVKIIMSNHDFDITPDYDVMVERLTKMQSLGADVVKMAVMPKNPDDLLSLLRVTREMRTNHNDTPVVTMSMGMMGAVSRITGEVFGSAITFGAVGEISAPGQIPVKDLEDILSSIHNYCVD